jgi:hypothetical protein
MYSIANPLKTVVCTSTLTTMYNSDIFKQGEEYIIIERCRDGYTIVDTNDAPNFIAFPCYGQHFKEKEITE